jgi:hypothetical protein
LQAAQDQAHTRVLGDVSVDIESYSFLFFYGTACTVLRGRPVLDEQPAPDRSDEREKSPERSDEGSDDSNESSGSDKSEGSDE